MHAIDFVSDDQMPAGHDFMFIEVPHEGGLIFYRESAVSPESLEGSWAAFRAIVASPPPPPLEPPIALVSAFY